MYTRVVCRSPYDFTRGFLNAVAANGPRAGEKIREAPDKKTKGLFITQSQKWHLIIPDIFYLLKANPSPAYTQGKRLHKGMNARRWESWGPFQELLSTEVLAKLSNIKRFLEYNTSRSFLPYKCVLGPLPKLIGAEARKLSLGMPNSEHFRCVGHRVSVPIIQFCCMKLATAHEDTNRCDWVPIKLCL